MRYVKSMKGLGDNIYQRAFVKKLNAFTIDTPWPELYDDLPSVKFIRSTTPLRTQAKNVARQPSARYGTKRVIGPSDHRGWYRPGYGRDGIINGMRAAFGFEPAGFDLPATMYEPLADMPPRYAVVRPVTVRSEWRADSRNPDPVYVATASQWLMEHGYHVVSVADLVAGQEWLVGDPPPAHQRYHAGELNVTQLMRLVANASAVVGGIGWIVPAAIATHVPALIICGGQGGYNSPHQIIDDSMTLDRIRFVAPDNFCQCTEKTHECDKRIIDTRRIFEPLEQFCRIRDAL